MADVERAGKLVIDDDHSRDSLETLEEAELMDDELELERRLGRGRKAGEKKTTARLGLIGAQSLHDDDDADDNDDNASQEMEGLVVGSKHTYRRVERDGGEEEDEQQPRGFGATDARRARREYLRSAVINLLFIASWSVLFGYILFFWRRRGPG
jgi:hypothetical protein